MKLNQDNYSNKKESSKSHKKLTNWEPLSFEVGYIMTADIQLTHRPKQISSSYYNEILQNQNQPILRILLSTIKKTKVLKAEKHRISAHK